VGEFGGVYRTVERFLFGFAVLLLAVSFDGVGGYASEQRKSNADSRFAVNIATVGFGAMV
jgi:DNA-binding helix-hairpin-helix protein with protein kinase domain